MRELRRKVVVGLEGRLEIARTDLVPGTTAEVIVLFADEDREAEIIARKQAFLEKAWMISDKAIAEGMETWDIDRINQEVAERRYGDRERY